MVKYLLLIPILIALGHVLWSLRRRARTIGYCTRPGIRDKFSDHTCLVGELKWPKPRANVGFMEAKDV